MSLQNFGAQLCEARRKRHLSQADLAAKLGMSRATISGIERGTVAEIGIRKFMALCSALDLELTLAPRRGRPTFAELQRELRNEKAKG
jgi:HTH-type transcriptional regulator / antitoxin HipB